MKLNTCCLLVAVGLLVRLTLAGKEVELVNNTVTAKPTDSNPVQQLFREVAHALRASVGSLGSKIGSPPKPPPPVTEAAAKQYAIVVDAGSSKTKMLLYQWENTQNNGGDSTFKVDQISKCKAKGRVSKCLLRTFISGSTLLLEV